MICNAKKVELKHSKLLMPIGVVLVNSSNLDKRCQWRKNEVAMNLFVGAVSNESKYFGNSIKSCTLCTKMSCCFPTKFV